MLSRPPLDLAIRQPTPPNSFAKRIEPSAWVTEPVVAHSAQRLHGAPTGAGVAAPPPPPPEPPEPEPPEARAGAALSAIARAATPATMLLREMDIASPCCFGFEARIGAARSGSPLDLGPTTNKVRRMHVEAETTVARPRSEVFDYIARAE